MGSCVGTVRHAFLRGEPVISSKGILTLDPFGRVTGVTSQDGAPIELSMEDALSIPDFLELEKFPVGGDNVPPLEGAKPEAPAKPTDPSLAKFDAAEVEAMKAILADLAGDPKNLNSEGKVDMTKLNSALTSNGFATVSGKVRDALAAA